MSNWDTQEETAGALDIAVIGMSGRFPGAETIGKFWQNLRDGVESISFFSEHVLREAGVNPSVIQDPEYVKARGILTNVDLFDAAFFGFYPREAEALDPQQRIFLECAWEAFEDAGYDPGAYPGLVGVFGGVGMNTYLWPYLAANRVQDDATELYQLGIGNDKDFLTTRVSFKLNLRGPSIDIQTACSTSLVAVHTACLNLLNYQCDLALAGGVSIVLPQERGYRFKEGMILSPDGHCRAFDARAAGTISSNGAGVVVLKRLAEAVENGDHIYAVIKGSAVNNDGSQRVGYTAPGVSGQAGVISAALALADVPPDTISYIEAHGTGTPLGDPIEIAALTEAFQEKTQAKGFCAIGSVKTNLGHLDAAAGVAGLIKTVLALDHKLIPPSLHYEAPNPKIDFDNSPFYVNKCLAEWKNGSTPRRAGVSSFGIGGTNAHVVLEEAPQPGPNGDSRPWQLLLLSAKSEPALENMTANLAAHLGEHPDLNLADVAYTLQAGRKTFNYRRITVCQSREEALSLFRQKDPGRTFTVTHPQEPDPPPLAFMFSGQGTQYVNMGREVYEREAPFREAVDGGSRILEPILGVDLRQWLYPAKEMEETAAQELVQTRFAQPALFLIEYALARLWMAWGIQPQAMIGHSIGEYVAACLAGVFSLEDGLDLVAIRGRLMQSLPGGDMLSVPLEEERIRPFLDHDLAIAALNSPASCVISGPAEAIDQLKQRLANQGVEAARLHTSHAFHSAMMEPILEAFTEDVKQKTLNPPQIPYLSNVTGTWITAAEATDPAYYARHLRQTVRFADGIANLLQEPNRALLEVGPGRTLSTLARRHPDSTPQHVILNSVRHPQEKSSDTAYLLTTLGKLWMAGVKVDWPGFYANEKRRRVSLPTYPFERQRYWLSVEEPGVRRDPARTETNKKADIADWFYLPSWKRADLPRRFGSRIIEEESRNWLVFMDDYGLGENLADRLVQAGQAVVKVKADRQFSRIHQHAFAINPRSGDDYDRLLEELDKSGNLPQSILHLWSVTPDDDIRPDTGFLESTQERGFYSLIYLAQALGKKNTSYPVQLDVITTNVQEVTGSEKLSPEKATILGPCQVIPQEYPHITCRSTDVVVPASNGTLPQELIEKLIIELTSQPEEFSLAYREHHRWVQAYEPIHLSGESQRLGGFREKGVYLITGGLGRIGLELAEHLARNFQARLALVSRSDFPKRHEWEQWVSTHAAPDPLSYTVRRLLKCEEMGAEVMVLGADVSSESQMQAAIDQVYERFGEIHGVIHAAGWVGAGSIQAVQEISPGDAQAHFRAKMHGVRVLESVLAGKAVDFCLLQSSLSSVLGGLGFAAYAAANHYMDGVARKRQKTKSTRWVSVNWDGWSFPGGEEQARGIGAGMAELTITPAEGMAALDRVLSLEGVPQIIVSTGDLRARINQWIKLETRRGQETDGKASRSAALHARPTLQTAYVAPRNELERSIADKWQELLGIEQIGVFDSFFDLGGDSLLGTQLVSQLRSAFQVEFPLRFLFEDPTVASVAKVIEKEKQSRPESAEKIARIMEKLERLSEEEAQAMLYQSQGSGSISKG